MLKEFNVAQTYIVCGYTDIRRSIDGLAAIVKQNYGLEPCSGRAQAYQDESGLWTVALTCSEEAMTYIFNIENLGYLRYRINNVKNLSSIYSYRLYTYLLDNAFRFSKNAPDWGKHISVEEMRRVLGCTAETYEKYNYFNDLILKKCQKELNEKTNIMFFYEPDKHKNEGRAIKHLIIEVVKKDDSIASRRHTINNRSSNQSYCFLNNYSLKFYSEI